MGYVLYFLDKYNESIIWFDKALAIDPKYVSAISGKGDAQRIAKIDLLIFRPIKGDNYLVRQGIRSGS
jgi:tetratricopeptide (TPR) repeat protein